jgi:kinesin family protein C1
MSNESGAVSYPKSGENLGRGIELMHNGKVKSSVI